MRNLKVWGEGGSRTARLLAWGLLPLLSGCHGPTTEAMGAAAVLAVGLGGVISTVLILPLILGWPALRPALSPRWGGWFAVLGLQLALGAGLATLPRAGEAWDLSVLGLIFVAPGHLGLTLVLLRILWVGGRPHGHWLAPLLASLPVLPAASLMALGFEEPKVMLLVWFWTGVLGPVALLGTWIELWVKRRAARAAAEGHA